MLNNMAKNGVGVDCNQSMQRHDSVTRYSAALESLKGNDGFALCLHLQDCQIDDEKAFVLFSAMEHSDTVASVDLSNNKITDDGFLLLTKLLKEGSVPSLIVVDVRGNPITSHMRDAFEDIQREHMLLKIYHGSHIAKPEKIPEPEEDINSERVVNLYHSKWSAACTDNGDDWLLSKSRISDQSTCSLKDKVEFAVEHLKEGKVPETVSLATLCKEIAVLALQEVASQGSNGEGFNYLIRNFELFTNLLNMASTHARVEANGAGSHRISLLELIFIVVNSCLPQVDNILVSSGLLDKLLEGFKIFPNNNILHSIVFRCLQAVLSRPETESFTHLLINTNLPSFLATEGSYCSSFQQGRRPSYSGHIFKLSQILKDLENSNQNVKKLLTEKNEWKSYTALEGPFEKIQTEQLGELCGPRPVLPQSVKNFLQNPARDMIQNNQLNF